MREAYIHVWQWATRRYPLFVALCFTSVVAVLDYITGVELRLFPLYFIPLSLISGAYSTRHALASALGLAGVWAALNYDSSALSIYLGNIASQLAAFSVVALLVNSHKDRADIQQQLASTDSLTGLLNSRSFIAVASREVALQRRKRHPITMAYLDIDNFKDVNATLGHLGADDVLRVTAQAMKDSLRQTDFIGRVGGDEFAILLPDTSAESSRATLERLQEAVLLANHDSRMKITVSVGAIVFEEAPRSVNAMLELADKLMYEVKKMRKDGVAVRLASELPAPSTPDIAIPALRT